MKAKPSTYGEEKDVTLTCGNTCIVFRRINKENAGGGVTGRSKDYNKVAIKPLTLIETESIYDSPQISNQGFVIFAVRKRIKNA